MHEATFGFAVAALAGFLLTAVPNWTGAGPLRGARLAALFALWLAGRVALFAPAVPASLAAAVDLAFLPALAAAVAPGILARNARRNGVVVLALALLWLADIGWHADRLGVAPGLALPAAHATIGLLALLVALVGGRIVPAFTIGGMRMAGRPVEIAPAPRLDAAAIAALAATVVLETAAAPDAPLAATAALAAVLHAARLARWRPWRTLGVPLVWILQLGYAWLVVALALLAAAALGLVPRGAATHALAGGAIATMILAVMSRASLGHTGRALAADRVTVTAYLLVTLGAALRVAASFPGGVVLVEPAALSWSAGFLVFAARYAPILLRPRPDGRPG
jgi:uncharacterized protein involved in response to NO